MRWQGGPASAGRVALGELSLPGLELHLRRERRDVVDDADMTGEHIALAVDHLQLARTDLGPARLREPLVTRPVGANALPFHGVPSREGGRYWPTATPKRRLSCR